MAEPGATLLARLAAAVGPSHVLTAPADLAPWLTDWRGRYTGRALALVRPGSTAEVAAVVAACREHGVPIVPQGGNTSMCGAATPDTSGNALLLSLGRMHRVRAIDSANATLTVEAGVTLAAAQDAARAQDMLFPLSLASEGSATVGGVLSTNAGGTAVLRYGNARELVLGLEVVLADGRVWDGLRGLRKDNTGYDLKQLFVGAEGTLGIVTAAVLKLFPAPRSQATAFVAVPDPAAAVALLGGLRGRLADRLTGFELIGALPLALCRKHHPALPDPLPGHAWYVLVQADDGAQDAPTAADLEAALGAAAERGLVADATIAQSQAQAAALWALRENISEGQRREGPNVKHDISLPVSAIPRFLDEAAHSLRAALPGVRFVTFGHLGDGNLHYNLSAPEREDATAFMANAPAANRIVHDLVAAHGGSISAEHGIGQLKRDELARYKSALELELMRRVKDALDPQGLMNPGKVL
ncbi:MAG: FAD-binding oxidoreductase [Betaproteobacteria bacterium]|nr:FAD-binding oxidoreductase [Betaproteobacteria bacterium]MDH5285045.1 FAD-binding oxidoreductase [Betaproteobacteria bacterium]